MLRIPAKAKGEVAVAAKKATGSLTPHQNTGSLLWGPPENTRQYRMNRIEIAKVMRLNLLWSVSGEQFGEAYGSCRLLANTYNRLPWPQAIGQIAVNMPSADHMTVRRCR